MKKIKYVLTLSVVALLIGATAYSASNRTPAIHISLELTQTQVSFPDSYKDSMQAIYAAYNQIIDIPNQEKKIQEECDKKIAEIKKGKETDAAKTKKIDALKADANNKIEALRKSKSDLRNAFLFLAEDSLLEKEDPYVYYLAARQFYEIKGEPPAIRVKKPVEDVKQITFDGKEPIDLKLDKKGGKDKKKGKDAKAEEKKPDAETKESKDAKPTDEPKKDGEQKADEAPVMQYKNNYERIEDYCKKTIKKFNDFLYLADVYYLLGVVQQEMGKQDEALETFTSLYKQFPKFPLAREVLFRRAELTFNSPKIFDRFDQAYELYDALASGSSEKDVWYFRGTYKRAWSAFMSMNSTEEAKPTFLKLYQEIDKLPEAQLTKELNSMKAEAKHILTMLQNGLQP